MKENTTPWRTKLSLRWPGCSKAAYSWIIYTTILSWQGKPVKFGHGDVKFALLW